MEIPIFMRFFLFLLLVRFIALPMAAKAQSDFPGMLACMLESTHWQEFYCVGADGMPLLAGIITHNKLPLYAELSYKGKPVEMKINAPKSKRHLISIKKVRYTQDLAKVKVVYDQRVKARFTLGKDERGQWFVVRSIFKQQYACGGKTKKKSFIWHF